MLLKACVEALLHLKGLSTARCLESDLVLKTPSAPGLRYLPGVSNKSGPSFSRHRTFILA